MPATVIVQHRSHSLLEVLAASIATEPGMRLPGVAHNGAEALRLCQREQPDVAIGDCRAGRDGPRPRRPLARPHAAGRPAPAARRRRHAGSGAHPPRAADPRLHRPGRVRQADRQGARHLGEDVENLQHRLFRKLGVRNRAEAIAAAHSRHLLNQAEENE